MASSSSYDNKIVLATSDGASSSSPEPKIVILTSSDGEPFEVNEKVARELQIVSNMIDDDCADKPIPLANVNSTILSKVIEYCKHHVEEEGGVKIEEEDKEAKKTLQEWEKDFVKDIETGFVFQLTLAANYLNIKGLLDLTCQTVADRIKDMSVEEVRTIFNIENDYTPEEEAQIREENKWAFE